MKGKVTKPYGNIYFEKNLPKNCEECPFQYDNIACTALEYDKYPNKTPEELIDCLMGENNDRRYSGCPLRLKKKNTKGRKNERKNNIYT